MSPCGGLALALLLAGCTCRNPTLEPVPAFVRVEPLQVDFGRIVIGQAEVRTVALVNSGRAPLDGTWTLTGPGFASDDGLPRRASVGSTVTTIVCAPDHLGLFDGTLRIALAGFEPIDVPLACEGVRVPECRPSGPCTSAAWDLALGRCIETLLDEGTGCQVSDVCLLEPTCHAGRCEGRLRGCDDGDPCTADTCSPSLGCQHFGPIACPGAGPCRVGQCRPGTGCGLVNAPDGVPCGQLRTCVSAEVCIEGACVVRDPPDGFECLSGGPCGTTGRCVTDVCVAAPQTTLTPTWTLAVPQPDAGPPEAWSDLFADRDGGLTVSSYFVTPPRLRADGPTPVNLGQNARRCMVWLGWVVCGDLPALRTAPVSALDPGTGQIVWTFSGAAGLIPEFASDGGDGVEFFTARLAVMNENELLALYESRTIVDGVDPRCRHFGLVVLDRQGQALRSRFLADPIFQTCDHPHSYGVAVDAYSNVYLAFTPSDVDNPAMSLTGTTIFSFSPSLQLRWRAFATGLPGGELAVGDGLLFQQHSADVRSTQTGAVVATLPAPFGLGVIGDATAVNTQAGAQTLSTLSTATQLPRWQATLTGTLGRTPLTLANWDSPWGPREVALAFTTRGSQVLLEGTELLTGASAFVCPVQLSEVPALTAMSPAGLGVMVGTVPFSPGAPSCDDCDPKFARTRSSFGLLPVPGLSPSRSAWSGAWGDEGHSHHEGR